MFIDLHTHSLLSDGELLPSELIRRVKAKGLIGVAITDHVDESNIIPAIEGLLRIYNKLKDGKGNFYFIPGVELTHIHPESFSALTKEARRLGARLVIGHGETLAEPVLPGTNRAAIEAGVDILAHPGLISKEDAILARDKGVYLEISSRKGHSLCNGHVVKVAYEIGAKVVFNTDAHSPSDLLCEEEAIKVLIGSGLTIEEAKKVLQNNIEIAKGLLNI